MISRIEVGSLRRMPIGAVAAVADAFGGSVDLTLRWEGAQLDHLTDAAHAWLTEATASFLEASGWTVRTEVSFNHFGDRGRVDVLAWHPSVRALAVVEVKSAIGDVQEALGRLDTKVRLGRVLAREAGWSEPAAVVRALVIGGLTARPARRERARPHVRRVRVAGSSGARVGAASPSAGTRGPALVHERAGCSRYGRYTASARANRQIRGLMLTG
jgi:hypothetical protein